MNVAPNLRNVVLTVSLALTWACHSQEAPEKTLKNETITVGCGSCMFHMPEVQGCPFAAEIDGKHYLIQGRVPEDHDSHAKDGICLTTRKAVVDGVIRGDKLVTTRLELQPAEDLPSALSAPLKHEH